MTDVRSDFILSPHYSAVYANVGSELWDEVADSLRAGRFEPQLPITIEVPKTTGITRPGSILCPQDRLVYQAMADIVAPQAEKELDRQRVFSNVLLAPDPECQMFEPGHECWNRLQAAIRHHCNDPHLTHAVKADVASFFERLYQHNLVNLLDGCDCDAGAVNLVEKLLKAWTERDSHGIPQGVFPSDFFGNFFLAGFDSDAAVRDVPSARYVDDIYLFYPDRNDARKGLVDLTRLLRNEGLGLNDRKTQILDARVLLHEETETDRLFDAAREEVQGSDTGVDWYGYETLWSAEGELGDEELEMMAVEELFSSIDGVDSSTAEKIEKFCLPNLAAAMSDSAVERALKGLNDRPHLSKIYIGYLAAIASADESLAAQLERLVQDESLPYDWQLVWAVGALMRREVVEVATVNALMRLLLDGTRSAALRGLAAVAVGKLGHATHRRNLRHHYSDEQAEYVRSAILYAARWFPAQERNTALGAWAGHSSTQALIAKAVRRLA